MSEFWNNISLFIVAVASLAAILLNIRKTSSYHREVNSRLTKLLELTETESLARGEKKGWNEGIAEGRREAKETENK